MSKAILLSVRPYWAYLIWKLLKTLELRKIVPKFINMLAYIYVTIRLQDLKKIPEEHREMVKSWMGKVPMRFWFEEYDKYTDVSDCGMTSCGMECENDFTYKLYDLDDELEKLCLTYNEVYLYGQGKDLYAWHIKKLEIFDEPMDLNEFKTIYKTKISSYENGIKSTEKYGVKFSVTKAPQNYMYVEVEE